MLEKVIVVGNLGHYLKLTSRGFRKFARSTDVVFKRS